MLETPQSLDVKACYAIASDALSWEAPRSRDREGSPFAASLLSRGEARPAGDQPVEPASHGSGGLTARERDILAMIGQGGSNKRVARKLKISPETVKSHLKHIFSKLAVSTRTEAVFRAMSLKLL